MKKNLLITLALFFTLIIFGFFVFMRESSAQANDILLELLELPAPPPPNPLVRNYDEDRPPEFFSPENPPGDDAPIKDLLDYWENRGPNNLGIEPSDRVLDRIIAEIEKNPELINHYLNILDGKKEAVDAVKRIYDRALNQEDTPKYQIKHLKEWLKYSSDYFSDELLQAAQQVADTKEYVTNQKELMALALVDWEKARPLLDRMVNDASQPVSQTLARWAFYLHALKEGNSIEAGGYRAALMKTVEDRRAKPGNRDLAFDALVFGGDFAGRDDWYFTLLEDETLFDLRVEGSSYSGLTTILLSSPPEKYADKMIELLKSGNAAVRNAAARNLATILRGNDPKIVRALLPWLENPDWAKQVGNERQALVRALSQVEMPESVPGLIAVLNEKELVEVDEENYYSNSNVMLSNTARPASTPGIPDPDTLKRMISRELYPYRDEAIDALIKQKSPQAVAALRQVLPEVEPWKRQHVIKAILVSGGFTIPEQVEALELYARERNKQEAEFEKYQEMVNSGELNADNYNGPGARVNAPLISANSMFGPSASGETLSPADIKILLGSQLTQITDPPNELVLSVAYRINLLDRSEPQIAGIIRAFLQNWGGAAVNAVLLDDLANGKSDLGAIVKLLSLRKELREQQINNIYDARSPENPVAFGISACLLEIDGDYAGILTNGSDAVKIALLGCARLIRAPLPVQTVAQFLKNPNKTLALAAERYIESEDSPTARQIIYSLYPNEAKILGARSIFSGGSGSIVSPKIMASLFQSVAGLNAYPPYYYMLIGENLTYEKLKKEVIEDENLLGIYAYDKNFVRIHRDRAVFSWEEDEARYYERKLSDAEFAYLKNYLTANDVNNLPPFISNCGLCESKELVMLGRAGGRRVFVSMAPPPPFFAGLENIFEDMRKPPAKLRYWLEKDIAGLEILFADKDLQAKTVWKNGADLRVLINDTFREEQIEKELSKLINADMENPNIDYQQSVELDRQRRAEKAFASYSWHRLLGNKLTDLVGQPTGVEYITPSGRGSFESSGDDVWTARAGNVEIIATSNNLLKVSGGQTTEIRKGFYRGPVLTADGRWVVLIKYEKEEDQTTIVRVNLETKREFEVKIDAKNKFPSPGAYLPSVDKILIMAEDRVDYYAHTIKPGSYFLLDAQTGTVQLAKGEFRPFLQQAFRRLQNRSNPDETWAAIPDEDKAATQIGVFNLKTFVFEPVLNVPRISFDSMDMWVDEAANKVFVVYNGQVLSIPLRNVSVEAEKLDQNL